MVAKPPVITAMSSDCVMVGTKGRISIGASVWPTKMLADAESDSAPEVPIVFIIRRAKMPTTHCRMPK